MTIKKRALFLLTDAYGSQGGISRFNRDLCEALSNSNLDEIVPDPFAGTAISIGDGQGNMIVSLSHISV